MLGICISRKPVAVANRYVRGPPSPWRPAIGPSVPGTTLSCPAQRCGIFSAHVRSSRRLAAHHVPVARGMQRRRSAARPAAFLVRRGRSLAHASIGRNATSCMQGPDSRMMMQHAMRNICPGRGPGAAGTKNQEFEGSVVVRRKERAGSGRGDVEVVGNGATCQVAMVSRSCGVTLARHRKIY